MEWVYIIIGLGLIVVGFIGCFLPILPGPALAYAGLLLQLMRPSAELSSFWLIMWGVIVVIVAILDYWFPIYGTKIFGGTNGGSWGSAIGLIIGLLFLGPFGILIGPFAGAYIGELMNKQDSKTAFKSAIGSFLGFLAGTLTKVMVVFALTIYFIYALF
jgi:hypothetical protein